MGMTVKYVVEFRPDTEDDYFYDLVIYTEREKYTVPITAVGRRPALDFPNDLDFGTAPLKFDVSKSILVTNVGGKHASFEFSTSAPFSVYPKQGSLSAGHSLQCTLGFKPGSVGVHTNELKILYDYGEAVYAKLNGFGIETDVYVVHKVVDVLPTYVTKMSQRSFKIYNRSGSCVCFSVRDTETSEEESSATALKLLDLGKLYNVPENSGELLVNNCDRGMDENPDALLSDIQTNNLRHHSIESKRIRLDKMYFNDENFVIHPLEGFIPPGSEVEITVEFRPTFAREYEKMAFVEVQGRRDRIPIVIKAKGLGPEAVFSYDMLDVGDTFVNTMHQYEVELQNRGKIDAQFRLIPWSTVFGSKFEFFPDSGSLYAGQILVIKVRS